eukprot:5646778-Pyramimonas_sp.AAC.1
MKVRGERPRRVAPFSHLGKRRDAVPSHPQKNAHAQPKLRYVGAQAETVSEQRENAAAGTARRWGAAPLPRDSRGHSQEEKNIDISFAS